MRHRRSVAAAAIVVIVVALVAVLVDMRLLVLPWSKDAATWTVPAGATVAAGDTTVTIEVLRSTCASDPGQVRDVDVAVEADRIVLSAWLSAQTSGASTCSSLPAIRHVVDLGQPVGQRALVDGYCLRPESRCTSSVRWVGN